MSTGTHVIYDGTYIDSLVKSVTWSGDIAQASRKLTVKLSNTLDGRTQALKFEHGKELRFISDNVELFVGPVFSFDIDHRGQMSVTAYDENTYLTRNQDTRIFRGKTASGIVKQLCSEFGIPTGTIADTGYVIPKLILRDKTLWEMMITALTYTRKQTGRRFFISSRGGKLHLLERKDQAVRFVIENGVNLLSASYSQSIEDMRTQVKVIGGDPEKKPITITVKSADLVKRFGIMQHLENVDSDLTPSQIKQRANQLLTDLGTIDDDATVEALGIDEVYAGKAIYVFEPMTGITGSYYVQADTHMYEGGLHTMSLTLSATDELPELQYEEPVERKRKGGGDSVDFIFGAKGTG